MSEREGQDWTVHAGLLSGVSVVELSSGVAGAYCGLVLSQLGARVARFGERTLLNADPEAAELMQQVLHGGKIIRPSASFGAELAQAHIVIAERGSPDHQYARQIADVFDGRAALRQDAVVVLLSANGCEEDLANPGNALTSVAAAGMSTAIGNRGELPLTLPYDLADYQCGISGAAAALTALLGGASMPVDVASRDVLAGLVGSLAQNYVPYGRPWRREGRRPSLSGGVYPCGLFPCKDGYVAVYCRSTPEWKGLLRAMGDPAWSGEERFEDPKLVATLHADEADSHLEPWLSRLTRGEVMGLGTEFGFPVAPVKYVQETLQDEQFAFRRSFRNLERGSNRTPLKIPAPPWRFRSVSATATSEKLPSWAAHAGEPRQPSQLLAGLRVLDFTWVWSGPMVTSFLADLGAEVIKVEHPSRLDSLRMRGRPLRDGVPLEGPSREINPWFNQLNHGKKSICADLKLPSDGVRLRELARSCDVVVENMRPGALADSGLGYLDLAEMNPAIVMLSMSMAGQAGPLSKMKGYAGIMTAMAGLESITGYQSDARNAPFVGMTMTALGDPNGAKHGLAALLAALYHRTRSGRGTWIDLAQTDAILSVLGAPLIESQLSGYVPVRGNSHPSRCPHGHFRCRGEDRWIAVSVTDDEQWRRFANLLCPDASAFARLTLEERRSRQREIEDSVQSWSEKGRCDELIGLLRPLGIACAPVASHADMLAADWTSRRRLTRSVCHPYLGPQDVFVPPWQFDGHNPGVAVPAPLLGQHTAEIFGSTLASSEASI